MSIIEQGERSGRRAKFAWPVLGVLGSVVAVVVLLVGSRPPQLGSDKEAFSGVDALFTAVTARDENLLTQCEQRLHDLRDAGKLPRGPAEYLDKVVRKARSGKWEAAAETLYEFMKAQRRAGADQPPKTKVRTSKETTS